MQSTLSTGNSVKAVKTMEEPLGRERRNIGKKLIESELIDRKHCQGDWLVVCEAAEVGCILKFL